MGRRKYEFRKPDLINVAMTLDSHHKFTRLKVGNEPLWVVIERFLNDHKDRAEMAELIVKLQNTIAADRDIINDLKQTTLLAYNKNERAPT
jgi:hypothetical protein